VKNVLDTITSYREARHWSNYDLASHAGIKPTTISTWYSKNIMPTLPTLVKVCDAFGITLTEFFSVVESGEREPVVLTHEQAEMLEKWSALRPEQKEACRSCAEYHAVNLCILSFIMDSNRDFPFYYHGGLHRAFSMLRPITLP